MSPGAAVFAYAERSRSKIYIVHDHGDVFGLNLVKRRRLRDRLAGIVHVCFRLHEKHALCAYLSLGAHCLEAQTEFSELALLCDVVDRKKSGIMPRPRIFLAGISETRDYIRYSHSALFTAGRYFFEKIENISHANSFGTIRRNAKYPPFSFSRRS